MANFGIKIEGLFTILTSLIIFALFPGTPTQAKSLLGLQYFSERELHIIRRRVVLDDPTKAYTRINITLKEVTSTVSHFHTF
jgi:hypothetical protein